MRYGTILMTAAALFTATALDAQETARARAEQALPPDVFSRVAAVADQALASGVPDEPVFAKALEGAAKGVPAARLLPAIQAYTGRLTNAGSALGPSATPALLVAGADALQRGVDAESLRELASEERHTPVAVLVLADLVETGVPSDRALAVLREAMTQRAQEGRMLDIPARVRQLIRDGLTARDAADRVRQAMQRGRGSDQVGPPVPPGSEPVTRDRAGDRTGSRGGSG